MAHLSSSQLKCAPHYLVCTLLLTTYYYHLPLTTYYLLLTTTYPLLLTTNYLVPAEVCTSLLSVHLTPYYLLLTTTTTTFYILSTYYFLLTTYYLLLTTSSQLKVVSLNLPPSTQVTILPFLAGGGLPTCPSPAC